VTIPCEQGVQYLLISGSIAISGARMATLKPKTGWVFEIVSFSSASYYPEHEIGCISMLCLCPALRGPVYWSRQSSPILEIVSFSRLRRDASQCPMETSATYNMLCAITWSDPGAHQCPQSKLVIADNGKEDLMASVKRIAISILSSPGLRSILKETSCLGARMRMGSVNC
jgi:hypothetical protein